jgi:hypothetical protein
VDVTVAVKVTVVVMIVVVIVWSTLIFQGGRMGKGKGVVAFLSVGSKEHRGLELPSGWSLRIKGL